LVEPHLEQLLKIRHRVEMRLLSVTRHLDVPVPDDLNPSVLLDDVRKLVDDGRVIQAIQVHRDRNGAGLAEAKRAIDEYRGHKNPCFVGPLLSHHNRMMLKAVDG
jgi:hypothetical protein